jgi:hypothetical protein
MTRLGDCRGIVDSVNEACTCGGNPPGPDACPACEVWHAIQDMEFPDEPKADTELAYAQKHGGRVSVHDVHRGTMEFVVEPEQARSRGLALIAAADEAVRLAGKQ